MTGFGRIDRVLVQKLQRGHGYRDMAFDEVTHKEKILSSRERFLLTLEERPALTREQRGALDREWANYFLLKGRLAEQQGRRMQARALYGRAIRYAPSRLRGYTRWLRTWV